MDGSWETASFPTFDSEYIISIDRLFLFDRTAAKIVYDPDTLLNDELSSTIYDLLNSFRQ